MKDAILLHLVNGFEEVCFKAVVDFFDMTN